MEDKEGQHNPVLEALKVEQTQVDPEATPYVHSVIDHEIRKLSQESVMRGPPPNEEYIELNEKSRVKLMHKIYIPVDRFPGFNFVGKILGNKGENLKKIALETKTRIAISGQGSAKKNTNVQELIDSGDPAHLHLKEPLHVRVESYGTCLLVWTNMAKAMEMLMPFMTPDETYQPPQPMGFDYGGGYDDPYAYGGGGGGFEQGYPPGRGGRGMMMMMRGRGRGRGEAPPFRGRGRGAPRGRGGFGGYGGENGANGYGEEMDASFGEGYQQAPAFGKSRGGPRGRGMPGGRGDGRGRGRPGRGRPY